MCHSGKITDISLIKKAALQNARRLWYIFFQVSGNQKN